MKKTNKRLLVAGGIFCAVGILFFGVGVASGGRNYIKSADLNRISGTATMDSSDSHAILSKTKLDAFSAVNIDLRNLDLDVKESDDDNFYIAYNIETNDGMLPLSYQVQGNTLNVVEKKGHESYSYIHIDVNFLQEMLGQSHVIENSNKVTIYIPKKTDLSSFGVKKAVISCSDGDVKIKDSALNSLEMEMELGDLHLKNTSVTNSQITLDDGDVKAENTVFQGKNKITCSLGDIKLSIPKEVVEGLSIEAEASDIDIPETLGKVMTDEDDEQVLTTENKPQDSLELKSEDGDIKITAEK